VNFIAGRGEPKRHAGAFGGPWNALFLYPNSVYSSVSSTTAPPSKV